MNTLEKAVHLEATVLPTFLIKLILVKWGFSIAASWEVYLFPPPKKKPFLAGGDRLGCGQKTTQSLHFFGVALSHGC